MSKVSEIIKKYKEYKADIVDIDIKIGNIECDPEEKEVLLKEKEDKIVKIRRIDNALTVLKEPYREIIEEILIHGKRYSYMQERLHLSYSRIKQLEGEAISKIKKYIL